MSTPLCFADVLLSLPVDDTLKTFLMVHQLPLPEGWRWSDNSNTRKRLLHLVLSHPQVEMREHIIAALHLSGQLVRPTGRRAMQQVVHDKPAAQAGLFKCTNDSHRAFWLYVHHPDLFREASEIEYIEHHGGQACQFNLNTQQPMLRDDNSLLAFKQAIKTFYSDEMGCGEACVVHVVDRVSGTQLVSVHVKDAATATLAFEGEQLILKVGNPNIHMCLEYSQMTGLARTLVRGGARYHAQLCEAFACHLLGMEVLAQRVPVPTCDLSSLRAGLHVPQANADGFIAMQIKDITVLSNCERLRLDCSATAQANGQCVSDLLRHKLASQHPLRGGWSVVSATLNFFLPPRKVSGRCEVISVEVTSKGRTNLHKFEERLRSQLEGYLVSLGILAPDQAMHALPTPAVQLSIFG